MLHNISNFVLDMDFGAFYSHPKSTRSRGDENWAHRSVNGNSEIVDSKFQHGKGQRPLGYVSTVLRLRI